MTKVKLKFHLQINFHKKNINYFQFDIFTYLFNCITNTYVVYDKIT